MTIEEAESITNPPIVGNYPLSPLTKQEILLAAYRIKQKYNISCLNEVVAVMRQIDKGV